MELAPFSFRFFPCVELRIVNERVLPIRFRWMFTTIVYSGNLDNWKGERLWLQHRRWQQDSSCSVQLILLHELWLVVNLYCMYYSHSELLSSLHQIEMQRKVGVQKLNLVAAYSSADPNIMIRFHPSDARPF